MSSVQWQVMDVMTLLLLLYLISYDTGSLYYGHWTVYSVICALYTEGCCLKVLYNIPTLTCVLFTLCSVLCNLHGLGSLNLALDILSLSDSRIGGMYTDSILHCCILTTGMSKGTDCWLRLCSFRSLIASLWGPRVCSTADQGGIWKVMGIGLFLRLNLILDFVIALD